MEGHIFESPASSYDRSVCYANITLFTRSHGHARAHEHGYIHDRDRAHAHAHAYDSRAHVHARVLKTGDASTSICFCISANSC